MIEKDFMEGYTKSEIAKELENGTKKQFPFFGFSVAVLSVALGSFFLPIKGI